MIDRHEMLLNFVKKFNKICVDNDIEYFIDHVHNIDARVDVIKKLGYKIGVDIGTSITKIICAEKESLNIIYKFSTKEKDIKYIMRNKIQHLCKTFYVLRLSYISGTHN